MRDIKKNYDWVPKLIAGLFLGGVAFLVLVALGVVGYLIWNVEQKPTADTSRQAERAASGQLSNPGPFVQAPILVPAVPVVELRPLPPLPSVGETARPAHPERPREKPVDIVAVRSFTGHSGPVSSVAFSPEEHRLLSGGADGTTRLWDLDTGKELARLEGHRGAVRDVAFAPEGKQAVSAGEDGTIRLWNLAEKKALRTFTGHAGSISCLAFTPDGKQLLSGGADRSLRVWDVESGRMVQELYGHDAAILCVSVSPDGSQALTGSADGGALLWEWQTGRELSYLYLGKPVYFALFTPDGKRAIIGGDAPSRLCDLTSGEQWTAESGVGDSLRGAALLPNSAVLQGGVGKRLEVRESGMHQLGQVEAHGGTISCVRATRDGQLALTASEDGAVKLWRIVERGDEKRPDP